ncbi:MAG TPA: hypothetical protein VF170_02125 [Planctomycetaceae bacterium]
MHEAGVRHLRTGISWADYHRPRGREWYRWQMERLRGFDVLLSVWHTPPSIAEGGVCAGPPVRPEDFSEFLWTVHQEFGDCFADFELWNEPNNRLKWAFDRFDPDWAKFSRMIGYGAGAAKRLGRRSVLGGMIPVDPEWLRLVESHGALREIDVVAIHGFPRMWWPDRPNWDWHRDWHGWAEKVAKTAAVAGGRPVWVTETGLATWDFETGAEGRLDLQTRMLEEAAAAPAERVYWYSLIDLDPARPAIEGFHVDENEYHLGLVRFDGTKKPAWDRFRELVRESRVAETAAQPGEPSGESRPGERPASAGRVRPNAPCRSHIGPPLPGERGQG